MCGSRNFAFSCPTAPPTVTWSWRHLCLPEVSALAGSWEWGAGSRELGAVSGSSALLFTRNLGAQAPWAWQVAEGQDELCSVPTRTLPSPQMLADPASRPAGFPLCPFLWGLSLPSCQGLIFPVYPFSVTPSSGPRKCQSTSWEHGPPAGERAALCPFVFGKALPISLCSAHMPRAAGQA